MEYLLPGAISESGQQLSGPDLESWMAQIGAWYEKYGAAGKLADPGHQLDRPETARTARSRRSRSMALGRAVMASQPPGLGGTPSVRPCSSAATNASCTHSSARPTSPSRAASAARIWVASAR